MLIKAAVSALHHKENFNGNKMDLAYITPQLIAAAMPTTSYLKAVYRTKLSTLLQFLNAKNAGHWHVWNLQEDCELGYDPSSLIDSDGNQQVTRVPVVDHRPVPVETLVHTLTEISRYLESDPKNVAVVHCKCGKGRTGSLISAYLMLYHGMSAKQASMEFTKHRMRLPLMNAISIPSQQRFLEYLERVNSVHEWSANQSGVLVTHVIIRNPLLEEYEVVIRPLRSGDLTQVRNWNVSMLSRMHTLRNSANLHTKLPHDLVLEYTGYTRVAGLRIPQASALYPFNVDYEPNLAKFELSPTPLALPGTSASQWTQPVSIQQSNDSGVVNCVWDDFDGISGFPLKGKKAFDSIEVWWVRGSLPLPTEPVFFDRPPSLNSLHEPSIEPRS